MQELAEKASWNSRTASLVSDPLDWLYFLHSDVSFQK